MRKIAFSFLAIVLVGCATAPATPTVAPAPPTAAASKPATTAASPAAAAAPSPAAAAPSPAAGAPSPAAAQKPAALSEAQATAEWDRVLAAAKREGQVAVTGPAGIQGRDALTEPFETKYGISVDFFGGPGRDIVPRVRTERAAGQYLWDIYVSGTSTGLNDLIPMDAFEPLEPALILPEVTDLKNWRNGELEFVDPRRQLMVMTPYQQGKLAVNPTLVDPKSFKSYKDLLDPKWKGKIVADDPRSAGPGQATFTFFYLHPELGEAFIRNLAKQELVFSRDFRQELDLLGRGSYPVLLGTSDDQAEPMMRQGLPVYIVEANQLRELTDLSPANGALALYNHQPHPNAAKIYVNWLLSKEGQTIFAQKQGYISARLDAPTDHAFAWRIPIPGAIKSYTQEAQDAKNRMLPLLKELFGE